MQVACASLKLILKQFTPLIRQNLAPPGRMGVDLSAEERYVPKCDYAIFCSFNLLISRDLELTLPFTYNTEIVIIKVLCTGTFNISPLGLKL